VLSVMNVSISWVYYVLPEFSLKISSFFHCKKSRKRNKPGRRSLDFLTELP